MKKYLRFNMFLALSGVLLATLHINGRTGEKETGSKKVEYLFVQDAEDVSFAEGKMTLQGISGTTVFFSDRPDRIAGHMTTEDFVKNWGKGEDSFEMDNPNATLAIFNEREPTDIVVELSNPVFGKDSLTYDIRILEGKIPEASGECSLFIDVIGRPLTPVSIAGVARRTTRRVIRYP